jgi:Uri superfamily endonuclease
VVKHLVPAVFTTYVLVIEKARSSRISIRKRNIFMEKGLYLYVGSAKKGLQQRLARHAKKQKIRFWHIDYITTRRDTAVRAIYLSPNGECETLSAVSRLGSLFGDKLGSSDCTCPSHFVKLDHLGLDGLRKSLTLQEFQEFAIS